MLRLTTTFVADWLRLLAPWEFSPAMVLGCLVSALLFLRGAHRLAGTGVAISPGRYVGFFVGLALVYGVTQTHYDYLAQHMFWVHRLQHLVLHHLGPFLIMLAVPHQVMAAGLPEGLRQALSRLWRHPLVRRPYRFIQQPWLAALLFVGLIYLWLWPGLHLYVMISERLYWIMNWSMLIDGLLFWWLIVDPRPPGREGSPGHLQRLVVLLVLMLPQILLGAAIAFQGQDIYGVYDLCGRAWPVSPLTDQQYGGLITWIPAAMMSVLGSLVVIRLWMADSAARESLAMERGARV